MPEILLIDELFTASDEKFRLKSQKVLKEFHKNKETILLTSHLTKYKMVKPDRVINLNSSAN